MALFEGVDWLNGFIIPLVEIIFIGGISFFILFYLYKAFSNVWKKQAKYIIRYDILRNKYPETTVKWIIKCIDNGLGWYDTKKILLIEMVDEDKVNETMWIYDKIIIELHKGMEGGKKQDGRKFKRSYSKDEGTKFPDIPSQAN